MPSRRDGRNHQPGKCRRGTLKEVIAGADVFIGVSAPGTSDRGDGGLHGGDAIIFACA